MPTNFDTPIERRGTDSIKWAEYGDDVLPLWVADLDFRSPEPIIQALVERVEHGVFGYPKASTELAEVVRERLATRHHLPVRTEDIYFLPNLGTALNVVTRTVGEPGDGVLMPTPIYPPFLNAVNYAGRVLNDAEMTRVENGSLVRYELDFDALEAAVTPRTRLLMFSNPHNPVGRVYTRVDLERLADIALRHDLILCSDEVHGDLIFDGQHVSLATLAPEVSRRCVTLLAPSKTFNIAGLECGIIVTENSELMARMKAVAQGIVPFVTAMAYTAATAAYLHGQPWLDELLPYLRANRETVVDFVRTRLPAVKTTCPEATYLAWLDCRALNLPESPFSYFLREAKVAFVDGATFGKGGEGFVRLNFGTQRATLLEALERVARSLEGTH